MNLDNDYESYLDQARLTHKKTPGPRSSPVDSSLWYVKVRPVGAKRRLFLASREGDLSYLKVKAVRFLDRSRAEAAKLEIERSNPGVEAFVQEAGK